jgi:ATP-dependent DNA helicase RecQ
LAYFGETYRAEKCAACDNCTAAPPVFSDITLAAQKFLSCVKRSGERYGAGHVIDILRGSKGERILRLEHDKLSTYGIGADLSEKQWQSLARQLVQMGYLIQDGEFRTLSLTPKANTALSQRSPISGQALEKEPAASKREEKVTAPQIEANNALLALLRAKRKQLADEAGVPPYVIFSDKTLVEMAAYYPLSAQSLLNISGVGQVKLQRYGEEFLSVILAYCQGHGLSEKKKPGVAKEEPQDKNDSGKRFVQVGEAYQGGESIAVLMERYQVTLGTVLDNLVRYLESGRPLRCGDDLLELAPNSPSEQEAVFRAFDEVGTTALKPVFERVEGRVDYNALKLLRLIYMTTRN